MLADLLDSTKVLIILNQTKKKRTQKKRLFSGKKALDTTITVVPLTHQVQRKKKHTVMWC